jgi:hypothetical protein
MTRRSVGMMAVVALGLLASGCGGNTPMAGALQTTGPIPPGVSRMTIDKVNDEHWTPAFRQVTQSGGRIGFTCRVLHCPDPANVIITFSTLRAKPTTQDLDKTAKDVLPKLIESRNLQFQVQTNNKGKIERLSTARTKIAGHDALLQEIKLSVGERSRVSSTAMLFIGKQSIAINAEAGDRAIARRSIDEFATRIVVEEGPSP